MDYVDSGGSRTSSRNSSYVSDPGEPDDNILIGNKFTDPDYFTRLKNQLLEMKSMGQFSDVTLIVNGKQYQCHRNILSAVSEYFRAMFTSGMKEQHNKEVPIAGVEASVFDKVIEYIYTGELEMDDDSVRSLCEAADMFSIEPLKQGCGCYLSKHLAPENCLSIWQLSEAHSMTGLAETAYKFSLRHFPDVTLSNDYLHLSLGDLCRYLGDAELSIDEEECVWEKAFKWLQYNDGSRLQSIMTVLEQIRLIDMDPAFLRNELQRLSTVFEDCPEAEKYVKEVLDHLVYGMPQPTTLPPLPLRSHTNYIRELVVLGGQRHNVGRCTTAYFYGCNQDKILNLGTMQLEHNWDQHKLPDHYNRHMACCEMEGDIYISGYGRGIHKHEVWRYLVKTLSWQYYGNMLSSREHHCMVTGNKRHLYILGGCEHSDKKQPLVMIEKHFVETSNEIVGELFEPVYMTDTMFYRGCIYIFGGKTKTHKATNIIQCFDLHSRQGYKLNAALPEPMMGIKCLLYGNWIMLLADEMTLVANMEEVIKVKSEKAECHGNKGKANQKSGNSQSKKDAANLKAGCSYEYKGTANQKAGKSHNIDYATNQRMSNSYRNNDEPTNQKAGCSYDYKDTANQKAGNINENNVSASQKTGNSSWNKDTWTFQDKTTSSAANEGTDNKTMKGQGKQSNKSGSLSGKYVLRKSLEKKDSNSSKRVVKIKLSKVASKIHVPSKIQQNNIFMIKSGVGKEQFGAQLLGNCVYIIGGRERANQGLFDYSACICSCPILDLIDPDKEHLEWTSRGRLEYFMTVHLTMSIRTYRPKVKVIEDPVSPVSTRSRSPVSIRSRSPDSIRSRSRSWSRSSRSCSRSRSRSVEAWRYGSRSRSRSHSRSYRSHSGSYRSGSGSYRSYRSHSRSRSQSWNSYDGY